MHHFKALPALLRLNCNLMKITYTQSSGNSITSVDFDCYLFCAPLNIKQLIALTYLMRYAAYSAHKKLNNWQLAAVNIKFYVCDGPKIPLTLSLKAQGTAS